MEKPITKKKMEKLNVQAGKIFATHMTTHMTGLTSLINKEHLEIKMGKTKQPTERMSWQFTKENKTQNTVASTYEKWPDSAPNKTSTNLNYIEKLFFSYHIGKNQSLKSVSARWEQEALSHIEVGV